MAYADPRELVRIEYTNHKGTRSWRHIRPIEMVFGSTQWHPRAQWLLRAWDVDKQAERTFAMSDVHAWIA